MARVGCHTPGHIVDLGCGPGNLTVTLSQRWPEARVEGIDSSPEMIESATELPDARAGRVGFAVGDIRGWTPPADVDVIISNAALQWVTGHRELVSGWAAALRPGAWLAFQVPGNFDGSSHQLLRELAGSPEWAGELGAELRDRTVVWDPADYARDLLAAGCTVDAWETTYLHQLPAGPGAAHPVLAWMEGTALRPVKAALAGRQSDLADGSARWDRFRGQLQTRLAEAYPAEYGVVGFPFRRVFVVARKR
jgi:trans-aconitate 2-methyltransferase